MRTKKQRAEPTRFESEADALKELRAIPLYFASSHALVKPYVTGFDSNLLDVPSLRRVRIDTNWTAPRKEQWRQIAHRTWTLIHIFAPIAGGPYSDPTKKSFLIKVFLRVNFGASCNRSKGTK